jgi:hypothetical protein
MGGVNASKDNYHMIQKQIRILENRLDKALIKFNEAISHNKTLRESIDDLRRERVVFENIYRKMERELQDRKQKMAEIIELSNQSYEQRDNYQMEVAAIEQANRKEQDEFEEQMVKLGELLESGTYQSSQQAKLFSVVFLAFTDNMNDSKLCIIYQYYFSELRLPTPGSTLGRFSKTSSNKYIGDTTTGPIEEAAGNTQLKTLKGTNWTAVTSDSSTFERVQNFEEAFNKIKAATGITDIEELVRTFIKNEDHNFSLFNYVNEQNNEVEKLEEQIQLLREEEKKFAQESGDDVNQHKQVLKELETKLQTTESMAEKYEIRCQDLQRVIESLKRGIQSIYEKFDVDEDGFGDPLVTESNMVHYLGQIEQKTNQLLQAYAEIKQSLMKPAALTTPGMEGKESTTEEFSPSKSLVSVLGSGPKLPMGHDLVHVNPPKIDDYQSEEDEDEDDDDARPLTREELKTRTLNRMQRKYQGGAKGGTKKKAAASKLNATR